MISRFLVCVKRKTESYRISSSFEANPVRISILLACCAVGHEGRVKGLRDETRRGTGEKVVGSTINLPE